MLTFNIENLVSESINHLLFKYVLPLVNIIFALPVINCDKKLRKVMWKYVLIILKHTS